MRNTDFAITLVRNESEATVLNDQDLQYCHRQLMTKKRELSRAEREFPRHVNVASSESFDRCFSEIPVQSGSETLHKLMYFSARECWEVCNGVKEFAKILWVKVAPLEEFSGN